MTAWPVMKQEKTELHRFPTTIPASKMTSAKFAISQPTKLHRLQSLSAPYPFLIPCLATKTAWNATLQPKPN